MTETPKSVLEHIEWLKVLLAVTAAMTLASIYALWTPDEGNRLGALIIDAIPSAIVILLAIPVFYWVFYRWGLSPPQPTSMDPEELAVISWTAFVAALEKVKSSILRNPRFTPDVVVSIGRSGAIAGAFLAGNLGSLRHLGIDRIHTYEQGNRSTELWPRCERFEHLLNNKDVLVVMAECVTGGTLQLARDELLKVKGIGAVRTAAAFRSDYALYSPDYVGDRYNGQPLVFRQATWRRDSMTPPRA